MNPCPCASLCTPRSLKRHPLPAILALVALAALICLTSTALAADDDRALAAPGPVRYVIVKAVGQGVTAEEAEQDALRTARLMAAKHYSALGGPEALDASPQGQRVIALHSSLSMGLGSVRAVALVEIKLKALPEPPPPALALPVLAVALEPAQFQVEANRPCEVFAALEGAAGRDSELLPGGGGAAYRLAPGKPMRQALPKDAAGSLRVVACTGGINAPATAPSLEKSLAKAREGKPRPAVMQGVVSECVEVQAALQKPRPVTRSVRAKGSEAPVNMTGAAGREAGLPVAKDLP